MSDISNLSINVRMYRQGLGDCFLLTFKLGKETKYNLLIDCGLLQGTEGSTEIMNAVAKDIQAASKATDGLNAVAVTHEHWDHISGFSQAQKIFNEITFHEVWLGWTEDLSHPKSKAMRDRFSKQITGLKKALGQIKAKKEKLSKMSGSDEEMPGFFQVAAALVDDFFAEDLGVGGKGRSATWEYIMSKGEPNYCTPGNVFSPKGLEGQVKIYVLGPPADFEMFTKTEPTKKDAAKETYREESKFALAGSFFASFAEDGTDPLIDACRPFEKDLLTIMPFDDSELPCKEVGDMFSSYFSEEEKWRQIDDDWLLMIEPLALHLDSYTNNSCLAFAVELVESGKVLVFPGDAQFGNWMSWKDLEFRDKDGKLLPVTTADLLNRTVLYKVGHHGSHNATLREHGLELMNSPQLAAMIPVDRKKAESKTTKTNPKGWEMPEAHLFTRLQERSQGRVIIADEKNHTGLTKRCEDNDFINSVKFAQKSFLPGTKDPLYVEYEVKN